MQSGHFPVFKCECWHLDLKNLQQEINSKKQKKKRKKVPDREREKNSIHFLSPILAIVTVYIYCTDFPFFRYRVQAYCPAVSGVTGSTTAVVIRPKTAADCRTRLGSWTYDHFTDLTWDRSEYIQLRSRAVRDDLVYPEGETDKQMMREEKWTRRVKMIYIH